MDPNENLRQQLEIAARLLDANGEDYRGRSASLEYDAYRLAELVLALNEWLARGGFLPNTW